MRYRIPRPSLRTSLPYLILLTLCAIFTAVQWWEYRALRRDAMRMRWEYGRAMGMDRKTFMALDARYRQAVAESGAAGPTRAQAEAALNGGVPFSTVRTAQGDEALYADPETGGRALLHFRGGRWTDVAGVDPYFALTYQPPPAPVSGARRVAYRAGLVVCLLILLFPWSGEPSENRTRVHWFVATGIAATWLAFLGPERLRAWNSMAEADSPGWGLFVFAPLAATLLLMAYAPARFRRRTDYPACPRCDYNLTGNQSGICPECGSAITLPPPGPPTPVVATGT